MSPQTLIALALAFSFAVANGCTDRDTAPSADAAPAADGFAPPNPDLVPAVGSDDALDIATWNIENFPQTIATARLTADLVASLEVDLFAVQEIADTVAFDELLDRLDGYEAMLSTHTYSNGSYQKVGFLYRSDIVTLSDPILLFETNGYEFPRPPMQVTVTVDNGVSPAVDFLAISLHLKAGRDTEDRSRRKAAMQILTAYIEQQIATGPETDIIVLGDYNEHLVSAGALDTFGAFIADTDTYRIHTRPLADAGQFSFVPSSRLIDHVISTASLDDELAGGTTVIPLLHAQFTGYLNTVSDHIPVVVSMPILQ